MTENDSLTTKQKKTIVALLAEPTQLAAAKAAGIGEKTLYRWLQDTQFQAALTEAENEAINAAIRNLVRLQTAAADVIAATLDNDQIPPGVRLRAAISVFDLLIRLKSYSQLEERLSRLEQLYEQTKRPAQPA